MYASLYPNLYVQYNIAPNTQIGKVIIEMQICNYENRRNNEQWDRAGAFFEDMHTHNYIIVGFKWFNLFGITEMKKYIENYFNTVLTPTCLYGFKQNVKGRLIQPMKFYDDGFMPMVFNPPMNTIKIKEWRESVTVKPNQSFRD